MTHLVDDQFLGEILRDQRPIGPDEPVFTTGYWYVRLCQAVLDAHPRQGTLSRPFDALPGEARDRAIRSVLELPASIGLVSLRDLAPRIAQLRHRHRLNILGMEALAAALHLEAHVILSAPSPLLERALLAEGRPVEVIR